MRLTIAGKPIETIKIEMRLTGWRSYFWKSDYWFKADDGLFLRFEGQSGPSGENRITVELLTKAVRLLRYNADKGSTFLFLL